MRRTLEGTMEGHREHKRSWRRWAVGVALLSAIALVTNADEQVNSKRSGRARVAPTGNPITLGVTTDRPTYTTGETIHITANAAYGDGSPVQQVKKTLIKIKDGAGRRVVRDGLENQGSGTFTFDHTTESDANLGFDPYRTCVGISEARLGLMIVLAIFGTLGIVGLIVLLFNL